MATPSALVEVEKLDHNDLEHAMSTRQGELGEQNELKREFKPRQVFMFSIACAIGTGLVIGSGTALSRGGPGSLLIAYLMVGAAVFFVMTGLGEMAAFLPMNKGFGGYASRMVDPAFGYVVSSTFVVCGSRANMIESSFATGWNYFFKYIIATPANLTAAGLVIRYWRPDLNVGIWVAVFGLVIIVINVSGATRRILQVGNTDRRLHSSYTLLSSARRNSGSDSQRSSSWLL